MAVNSRRKDGQSGEWVDKPNYFDVTVWGAQGENCANYLSKGRPVAVEGRLDWREWEAQDGSKRQAVEIIADSVQFLGSRSDNAGRWRMATASRRRSDVPADTSDFEGAGPARAAARTTTFRSRRRRTSRPLPSGRRASSASLPFAPLMADSSDRPRPAAAAGAAVSPIAAGRASTRGSTSRQIDYKDLNLLRRFISDRGKTRSRRVTGLSRKHQQQLALAVKRARELALLPYVGER